MLPRQYTTPENAEKKRDTKPTYTDKTAWQAIARASKNINRARRYRRPRPAPMPAKIWDDLVEPLDHSPAAHGK